MLFFIKIGYYLVTWLLLSPLCSLFFLCFHHSPASSSSPILSPFLFSLLSVAFIQYSVKNSTRRSYIIRRIQKLRLHRLNQVSSSASNCEGSSHHRSISSSLVLFLYNYPLFLTSFQNSILLKYSLFHRLSLTADPLLSLLSSYSTLPIPLVICSP